MKKHLLLWVAFLCSLSLNAKTLYLKAGTVDFTTAGAVVAIWTWGGDAADTWSVFSATSTAGVSSAEIADGRTGGKLVRFPGGTTPAWEGVTIWNQTGDLQWDSSKDCMELIPNADNSWDGLTGVNWSNYDGSTGGGDNGGGNGGNQGGGTDAQGGVWYYKGWIGQKDVEPSAETMFVNGVASFPSLSTKSNVMLVYVIEHVSADQYMTVTPGGSSPASPADFKAWDGGDKMLVSENITKLYLYEGTTAGTVTLSETELPGRTLVSGGTSNGGNQGGTTGGDLTVRFQKPDDWSTVNIYAWNGTSFGDWPGSPMTDNGNGWWSAQITAGTSIIFNNGSGTQTQNIEGVSASTCYTLGTDTDSDGHYSVNISTDCPALENALAELPLIDIQVKSGRIVAEGDLRIYDLTGQEVTSLNGNLHGLYIVRIADSARKVLVP